MISEAPRDLRYAAVDGEKYRKLTQEDLSPFKGTTFKDIFVYAVAYGFKNGLQKELEKPQPNIPLTAFSPDDIWLIKAIAIAKHGSLEILSDEKEIYTLAEEYANGAIDSIYHEVFSGKPGEPYKRMAQDVFEEFELSMKQ